MATPSPSATTPRSAPTPGGLPARLRRLSEATDALNSPLSLGEMLVTLADSAREIVGAHQAVASLSPPADAEDSTPDGCRQTDVTVSLAERYAHLRASVSSTYVSPMFGRVCAANEVVRLTHTEVRALPDAPAAPDPHLPLGNWLAAPLIARDGTNIGMLQVSDRPSGDFDDDDEALIVQLARVASNAIGKARLAERLAAQEAARFREELLSGISHDMQTPLAAVVGLADLLVRDPDLPAHEQHDIHQTISRQARALRGLVQQFLDFSRLESERPLLVRPRPTDAVAAIDRVVSLFAHQREILVGAAHGLPHVLADPDRLDQVLANLVSNAIKYSDAAVRIVARRDGRDLLIDVVDEGPGLAPEDQVRLFDKFHRGANAAGISGTGLGLYITRAVVETQGGAISVHSNVGVGSRFTVRFPLAEPAS